MRLLSDACSVGNWLLLIAGDRNLLPRQLECRVIHFNYSSILSNTKIHENSVQCTGLEFLQSVDVPARETVSGGNIIAA
jgi:hypothetical protein